MRLYCLAYGDGALIGASDDYEASSYDYWAYRFERDDDGNPYEDWCLFSVDIDDMETVNRLLEHGTSKQWYSDGYEAMHMIVKHGRLPKLVDNGDSCYTGACFPW